MEAPGTPGARICVSCGRSIAWDANVCQYCGHDYRIAMLGLAAPRSLMSEGTKILLYILSFLIPPVGMIIGVIYYVKPEAEYKEVGRYCIIISVIMFVIGALCVAALLA